MQYTAEQSAQLKTVLAAELDKAYTASSRSNIMISFHAPFGITMNYRVTTESVTIAGHYDGWVTTRGGAAVRHRTGRSGVGFGRRSGRSSDLSGARHRRRNRAQRLGPGATRPPGGRGGDESEARRHHSLRRPNANLSRSA